MFRFSKINPRLSEATAETKSNEGSEIYVTLSVEYEKFKLLLLPWSLFT